MTSRSRYNPFSKTYPREGHPWCLVPNSPPPAACEACASHAAGGLLDGPSPAHPAVGAGTSTLLSWPQLVKCSPSACCCTPVQAYVWDGEVLPPFLAV